MQSAVASYYGPELHHLHSPLSPVFVRFASIVLVGVEVLGCNENAVDVSRSGDVM